jgi:hypothetical protein
VSRRHLRREDTLELYSSVSIFAIDQFIKSTLGISLQIHERHISRARPQYAVLTNENPRERYPCTAQGSSFSSLLEQIEDNIEQVSADGAYDTNFYS